MALDFDDFKRETLFFTGYCSDQHGVLLVEPQSTAG